MPEILECKEFINADEIARGLSPFQPETVSIEAGRIMLNRINELLKGEESFAFETTLSTRSYKNKIIEAQKAGFNIVLLFFWLDSVNLAKERVKTRVLEGGHNIKAEVIERRYVKGIQNLFDIYFNISDQVYIFDNSSGEHLIIAEKFRFQDVIIYDAIKFNFLKQNIDEKRK